MFVLIMFVLNYLRLYISLFNYVCMFNMNLTTNDVLFIYGLSIAKLYVNIALFIC
jgi:hypothetical protein